MAAYKSLLSASTAPLSSVNIPAGGLSTGNNGEEEAATLRKEPAAEEEKEF